MSVAQKKLKHAHRALRFSFVGVKMAKARKRPRVDPEIEAIAKCVVEDRRDDTIVVIIPSHDRSRPQKKLNNQDQWAEAGLRLFSDLYGGATAFLALRGVWRSEDGEDLFDEPILIQSLVRREDAEDERKLERLLEFAKRMCRETNQECVAIIINDAIRYIKDQ